MPGYTKRDMVRLAQACAIVFASVVLLPALGQMVVPLVVAVLVARGRFRECGIVLIVGAIAGYIVARSPQGSLAIVTAGAIGLPVGFGIGSRWHYARTVAVSTAIVCAVNVVITLPQLKALREASAKNKTPLTDFLEGPDADEMEKVVYEAIQRINDNWEYLLFGLIFSGILMSVCVVVTLASRWTHRRTGLPKGAGKFSAMRPPEWLVWVVIATAALWFADRQWPSETLRIASWNVGVGLFAVYWLNGLGVIVYGIAAWKPHPLLFFALLMVFIWVGMAILLPILGLFDTWSNFRAHIDRLAAGRDGPQHRPDDTA
jgi:uncharacterized membrane protein YeaQ/YmgE (transglycosylase-associated protein family)